MQKKWLSVLIMLIVLALLPTTAQAASTQVFFENFNGTVSGNFSGIKTTTSAQGYSAFEFSGNMLWNSSTGNPAGATTLTLTGLPAHISIDINFLFGAIDSWDGLSTSWGPDYFNVEVGGVSQFHEPFPNDVNVRLNPPPFKNLAVNPDWSDRGYYIKLLNIPHTTDTVTIKFFASGAGWQGGTDESWGMDNLQVMVNSSTVPTPGTAFLLGSGMLGLVGWRRFRKN